MYFHLKPIRACLVIFRLLFAVVSLYGVQGCGQTGPLYLPGTPPPVYVPDEDNK